MFLNDVVEFVAGVISRKLKKQPSCLPFRKADDAASPGLVRLYLCHMAITLADCQGFAAAYYSRTFPAGSA
jgi:hypothetical protein